MTQILATLLPIFGFAETAARNIVIIVAVGFIPVLVLFWQFEITPEGIKRYADADRAVGARSTRTIDRAITVVLVLAVAYFAIDKFVLDPAQQSIPRVETSEPQAATRETPTESEQATRTHSTEQDTQAAATPQAEVFAPGNPFPAPFQGFSLGTKMSVLVAAFPQAQNSLKRRTVSIHGFEGLITGAKYKFDSDRIDPSVVQALFLFRRPQPDAGIWREFLAKFQKYPYEQSRVANIIYWDDIEGYKVTLTTNELTIVRAN